MSSRAVRAALLAVALGMGLVALPPRAEAAEYAMRTQAEYEVQPGRGRVLVTVRVEFRNTTPNPPGRFSVFEIIDVAIHAGARRIEARDARGRLRVNEIRRRGLVRVSVVPRDGVRFRERTRFVLTYRIPDGAPGVRVGRSIASFGVWSFGTRGSVQVDMPGVYDVSVDGDPLAAERTATGWRLTSGRVDDPARWLAQVLAVGPASHETLTRDVPLESGTVALQVRAWPDDRAWGRRSLDLLADALPLLEREFGIPYPEGGPLVVEETVASAGAGLGEAQAGGPALLAAHDAPAFTLLHQAAHVWLSEELVADRWIAEGFASWAAAQVARQLDVAAPYDPVRRREALDEQRFPLVSWGAGESSAAQDAFAYAAAWAVAEELADRVGAAGLREAWGRIAAGIGPYDPTPAGDAPPTAATGPERPVDSPALLDQLEAVSGADLARIFGEWVLDEAATEVLAQRSAARRDYQALLAAAGTWGVPEPVRVEMEAWRFVAARQRIAESMEWLADRHALAQDARQVGLALPDRLRDRYRTNGGDAAARQELDAQAAVVETYGTALERATAQRDLLERVGLVGGPEPDQLLAQANAMFAEGDLRGAADASQAALSAMENARAQGIARVAAAVVLVLMLLALAYFLTRRRGSDAAAARYTAAP
ncbi:MAG TPA: hypothetical protein VHK63_09270 [Candidatus Limnocylindria bacterium]|nr:hypothetical protein [Candidatus Limnocylindria bacterium]